MSDNLEYLDELREDYEFSDPLSFAEQLDFVRPPPPPSPPAAPAPSVEYTRAMTYMTEDLDLVIEGIEGANRNIRKWTAELMGLSKSYIQSLKMLDDLESHHNQEETNNYYLDMTGELGGTMEEMRMKQTQIEMATDRHGELMIELDEFTDSYLDSFDLSELEKSAVFEHLVRYHNGFLRREKLYESNEEFRDLMRARKLKRERLVAAQETAETAILDTHRLYDANIWGAIAVYI